MTSISPMSWLPMPLPWTTECLIYEHSILLRMAIDSTAAHTYSSAANSYLTFCKLHALPIDPTLETLSYYITFQSAHINPKSVESYLSGICNNLKLFFPDIHSDRATALIKRTLKACVDTMVGQPFKSHLLQSCNCAQLPTLYTSHVIMMTCFFLA